MPRRTNREITRIHVSLATGDVALLDRILHDPRTGKARYGARAQLIERLLIRFIVAYKEGDSEIRVDDLFHILN